MSDIAQRPRPAAAGQSGSRYAGFEPGVGGWGVGWGQLQAAAETRFKIAKLAVHQHGQILQVAH